MDESIKSGPGRGMSMYNDPQMKECVAYSGTQRTVKEKDEKKEVAHTQSAKAGRNQRMKGSVDQNRDTELQSKETPLRSYNQGSSVIVGWRDHWQ